MSKLAAVYISVKAFAQYLDHKNRHVVQRFAIGLHSSSQLHEKPIVQRLQSNGAFFARNQRESPTKYTPLKAKGRNSDG
jgi:hypothetical protein